MRYNRLNDIGLTDDQIKNNLLFAGRQGRRHDDDRARPAPGRQGLVRRGAAGPVGDRRSRAKVGQGSGADYLYTYLRTFYRDDTRPTGWNNMVFPNVAMPHALWELQGERRAKFVEEKDPHDDEQDDAQIRRLRAGHARAR